MDLVPRYSASSTAPLHIVIRWAAAASLGWIGLVMLAALPIPTSLYRLSATVSGEQPSCREIWILSFAILRWTILRQLCLGFFPCAMVYAARFYAMLSAWLNGAAVMFGFGLGTLPSVMGVGLGVPWLRMAAKSTLLQKLVGLAIVAIGIVSALPAATISIWCKLG